MQARMYRKRISHIASRIGLKYDVVISILFRMKAEFTQGIQYLPFYQNISREGVSMFDRRIDKSLESCYSSDETDCICKAKRPLTRLPSHKGSNAIERLALHRG